MGKLVVVLPEAAFAGDKKVFDRMKELITGEDMMINPKFKAPITVDNCARMVVISNHEHFVHIKPGDRRYTAFGIIARMAKHEQVRRTARPVEERRRG